MTSHSGVLRAWRGNSGFGFIYERVVLPDRKSTFKSYFVHISDIVSGEPVVDSIALFNVATGKTGKCDKAIEVELLPNPSQAYGRVQQ